MDARSGSFGKPTSEEEYKIQNLLDDEDLVQELRNMNPRILKLYFSYPLHIFCRITLPNISQLVQLISTEPPAGADDKRNYKYPFMAAEILSCEAKEISDLFFEQQDENITNPQTQTQSQQADNQTTNCSSKENEEDPFFTSLAQGIVENVNKIEEQKDAQKDSEITQVAQESTKEVTKEPEIKTEWQIEQKVESPIKTEIQNSTFEKPAETTSVESVKTEENKETLPVKSIENAPVEPVNTKSEKTEQKKEIKAEQIKSEQHVDSEMPYKEEAQKIEEKKKLENVAETQPIKNEESQPIKAEEKLPIKTEENKPVKTEEISAVKEEEKLPIKIEEIQPLKTEENKTINVEENQPLKTEENKTINVEENQPLKTEENKSIKTEEASQNIINEPPKNNEQIIAKTENQMEEKPVIPSENAILSASEPQKAENSPIQNQEPSKTAEIIAPGSEKPISLSPPKPARKKFPLLEQLFSVLNVPEVNPVLAGYFLKVLEILIERRQVDLLGFIFSNPDYVNKLLSHIYDKSISEAVKKLVSNDDRYFAGTTGDEFLIEKMEIISQLIDQLDPINSNQTIINSVGILSSLIEGRQHLAYFNEQKVLKRIFNATISGNPYSLIAGISYLTAILKLNSTSNQNVTPAGDQLYFIGLDNIQQIEPKQEEEVDYSEIMNQAADNLAYFKSILTGEKNTNNNQETQFGEQIKTFGHERLKVVEFLLTLMQTRNDIFCQKFDELEIPVVLLNLMGIYYMNSLLHVKIFNIFNDSIHSNIDFLIDMVFF